EVELVRRLVHQREEGALGGQHQREGQQGLGPPGQRRPAQGGGAEGVGEGQRGVGHHEERGAALELLRQDEALLAEREVEGAVARTAGAKSLLLALFHRSPWVSDASPRVPRASTTRRAAAPPASSRSRRRPPPGTGTRTPGCRRSRPP